MNMNQLTQKTLAALQRAQSLAVEYGHVDVQQEHLMTALTENPQDLVPQLLARCGISAESFRRGLEDNLSRLPRVSGSGAGQPGYAADIEKALLEAEKTAKQMKDEYLSVEHLWMGLCAKASPSVSRLLKAFGYSPEAFLPSIRSESGIRFYPFPSG